ncbi:MAG: DegT/DnrJ/EryC1/StrS family aminotransferase [Nitrospiraceae bacterium]
MTTSRHSTLLQRPMRAEPLVFGSPLIEEEDIEEVVATLRSGWLSTGPRVARFEQAFRTYLGAEHAIAVSSCTAALHLALTAIGIEPGDEVITTPLTFCATANAILQAGGRPVFADVERESMTLDPAAVDAAMTRRTKAIIPVHLAGRPCRMDELMAIARRHGLYVIEDAAHCIEGSYRGRRIGTFGDLACFSFYVTKSLMTGEGGMVVTQNAELGQIVRTLAHHGLSHTAWERHIQSARGIPEVVAPGFKSNMTDLQAALGLHQIDRLDAQLARRQAIWATYDQALADLPFRLPAQEEPDRVHARHLYQLLVDDRQAPFDRDGLRDDLLRLNIGTGIHYIALHQHPYYRDTFHLSPDQFPNAQFISERTLSSRCRPN